jgi:tRNA A37 methylthiotransferase MiaB
MGRRYSVNEWEACVSVIRQALPRATVATDIIVGFPGETDEDFEQTMNVIERVRPQVVNISKYGDRPGTEASKSQEKVLTDTKKARSRRLTTLVSRLSMDHNRSWIGWQGPAIVTEPGQKGGMVSRNESYKPVILHEAVTTGDKVFLTVFDAERTHLLGRTSERS